MGSQALSDAEDGSVYIETGTLDAERLWGLLTTLENAAQHAGHPVKVVIDLRAGAAPGVYLAARNAEALAWLQHYAATDLNASTAEASRRLIDMAVPSDRDVPEVPVWASHSGAYIDFTDEPQPVSPTEAAAEKFLTFFADGSLAEELDSMTSHEYVANIP